MQDRNQLLDENFIRAVQNQQFPAPRTHSDVADCQLSAADLVDIFESQIMSRHLDLQSRQMQKQGKSFYTIGSAGHEGNAAYARAFRPTDMAFLHYRSGAFMVQRSKQVHGQTPLYDMLLSFAASSEDPTSGGRHKVLGSKILHIPPQTSTIASHIPKAVGTAYSIRLAEKLDLAERLAGDSVVLCNFGDASANHSTAQGAINAACWAAYQSVPLPIVFVCEDNGIGISTATPSGWIQANFAHRPGLHYLSCDGLDIVDTYNTAQKAARIARQRKQPVFLHCRTIRLLGHAGSDAEFTYRSLEEIAAVEAQDPLLHSARILTEAGILTPQQVVDMYQGIKQRIAAIAVIAGDRPRLVTGEQVRASLIPPKTDRAYKTAVTEANRQQLFAHEKHNLKKPQHLAKMINWALMDLMAEQPNIVLCGEDVGKKGGVYNVTSNLVKRFGKSRVINTLLDEQSILGLGIGMAHNRILPIPEIQFLAYVHNAEDQIRGEAATLPFFSNGQFTNPMVIRIAGLAYQKGFGGHFHNDNSFAVFRDIPGIVVACPSNGEDAVWMLRESVRLAQEEQRVVIFLEPIALYMKKDLHEDGDNLWTFPYPDKAQDKTIALGELGQYGDGKDLAIITYGNGYYLSRQAEPALQAQGINSRIIDLRWLAPLNEQAIVDAVKDCKTVLIVDECRHTGSISEALFTILGEQANKAPKQLARVTAEDSFIPLGSASYSVLPSKEQIIDAANRLHTSNKSKSSAKAKNKESAVS
ncbi:MAG: dehydrogenase E1 component subunit alpha/beta [Aestuariibacter sp.]